MGLRGECWAQEVFGEMERTKFCDFMEQQNNVFSFCSSGPFMETKAEVWIGSILILQLW